MKLRFPAVLIIFAAAIPTFAARSAEGTVAMVYLIGPDTLQIMASDITSVDVGGMTEDGWRKRYAVRVCFTDAVHARIRALVDKDLSVNDHFKIVIGCAIAFDMRITTLEGTGNCNFFTGDDPFQSLAVADDIRKGMTKSSCAAYVS